MKNKRAELVAEQNRRNQTGGKKVESRARKEWKMRNEMKAITGRKMLINLAL